MRVLGVDPAIANAALALLDTNTSQIEFWFIEGQKLLCPRLTGLSTARNVEAWDAPVVDLLVVEGQEHYNGPTKAVASDIVHLAFAAGAIAATLDPISMRTMVPLPRTWAKQTPKDIRHVRLCKKLELSYVINQKKVWVAEENFKHIPNSQWEHLLDALGLAVWGSEQVT